MLILAFDPFVSTEHRALFCDSRWCKIHFVISEWLNNRAILTRIFCQLFQLQFFCMEFTRFVFEFSLIFGKESLYVCFLCFILIKSYLAGR